ncbi:nucleoside-diphosphate kinase [Ferrimicrobium acidiphilum]|jgi:nucleoside-diphosphate kinase|uniref:Nucleoside diphosphate kinase n=1 Tax=Ferrimicrobium acidiphilum DSM 19497 TaxID=1121877 RepID=A0A0D8FYY3_9ACTN|nr:nucleoside-diphosphate kinase [Ferrimicrobium acidiphilum]KJE78072.1 nucleoside diphosphate kinase [Ferrimicrobium acidiphilum DSM 19497]MCL5053261.1 nucleoside-diphosphate kinase [Gammaproteobacteria bacterium]
MATTFIILKPDAVERGLIGEITTRFERRGLRFLAFELRQLEASLVQQHYAEHRGKPFYDDLVAFLTRGPVVVGIIEGPAQVVEMVRTMMGATDSAKAAPGTIRGDLAMLVDENLIHGSDSPASAEREIGLFFPEFRPV